MPRMNGHVKRAFFGSLNVANTGTTAAMETAINKNRDVPINGTVKVLTRGGANTTFTKTVQE